MKFQWLIGRSEDESKVKEKKSERERERKREREGTFEDIVVGGGVWDKEIE